jgi:hypothetical protein
MPPGNGMSSLDLAFSEVNRSSHVLKHASWVCLRQGLIVSLVRYIRSILQKISLIFMNMQKSCDLIH